MTYESNTDNDETGGWTSGSTVYDEEPVTADECIRQARELLAEWKDSPAIDPLVAKDLEDASELLTRALDMDGEETDDL